MTRLQRVKEIAMALVMLIAAVAMIMAPAEGYALIIVIVALYFTIEGIRKLVFYFTMARFMVGGRSILYMGILMLDFGILATSLTDVPRIYLLLYLIAANAFDGVIEVLRAVEARKYGSSWRLKMIHGVLNLVIAICCIVFINRPNAAVFIYCFGMIYSAFMRIASACRQTKFIYIQ